MKDIYLTYLNTWKNNGGDLFCNFSSVTEHSKHGHWGAKIDEKQSRAEAPKYDALLTFIEQNDIWFIKDATLDNESTELKIDNIRVYPNPSSGYFFIESSNSYISSVLLYDLTGTLVLQKYLMESRVQISTSNLKKGIYFLSVKNSNTENIFKIVIQ